MKTILVAGGAGYIGSHMVALLVKRGYEVIVADNLRTGHWQAIQKPMLAGLPSCVSTTAARPTTAPAMTTIQLTLFIGGDSPSRCFSARIAV